MLLAASATIAGCATTLTDEQYGQRAVELMRASFQGKGVVPMERLNQDSDQRLCTEYAGKPLPKEVSAAAEAREMKNIAFPADHRYMGDWRAGERVAQSGQGLQFSDAADTPRGANCYACHQLSKAELSYGTIGPSLYNFGKLRGTSDAIQQYAYGKIYNAHAYNACSNMPRFGTMGILSEQQIKDLVALLLDPKSPVNQ